MKKAYLVTEASFDYNDEYYTKLESGTPDGIFTTKAAAEKYAQERNRQAVSGMIGEGLENYDWGDGGGAIWDSKEKAREVFVRFLKNNPENPTEPQEEVNAFEDWYHNPTFPEELTDADLDAIGNVLSAMPVFYVVEMEVRKK